MACQKFQQWRELDDEDDAMIMEEDARVEVVAVVFIMEEDARVEEEGMEVVVALFILRAPRRRWPSLMVEHSQRNKWKIRNKQKLNTTIQRNNR